MVVQITDKIFVGDVGTIFRGTFKEDGTAIDISTATTRQIIFEKPDGLKVTKTATFFSDGTDGILQYVSVANDINIGGDWRLQGYIVMTGFTGYSDIVDFKIYDTLT